MSEEADGEYWGDLGPDPPVNEDSVAVRFAEEQAGQLRYCGTRRGWYAFDGTIWRQDRTGIALARVRALDPKNSGASSCDPFAYKPPRAAAMGTARFAAGVERLARCDPALAVTADIFDADPFLIGTPDGPVALRSGRKLAADPSQNLTRSTAVGPAESAECPLWLRFLDQTFADHDLVRFLQLSSRFFLSGRIAAGCVRHASVAYGPFRPRPGSRPRRALAAGAGDSYRFATSRATASRSIIVQLRPPCLAA